MKIFYFPWKTCRRSANQNCLNNEGSDGQIEVQASVDLLFISQALGFTREEQQTVPGYCAVAMEKKKPNTKQTKNPNHTKKNPTLNSTVKQLEVGQ